MEDADAMRDAQRKINVVLIIQECYYIHCSSSRNGIRIRTISKILVDMAECVFCISWDL